MSEIANEGNETPLTDEQKTDLLQHHLTQAKRLTLELGIAEDSYGSIGDVPPLEDMEDATAAPEVKQAIHSLAAATAELNTAQTVVGLIEYIGSRLGFVLI